MTEEIKEEKKLPDINGATVFYVAKVDATKYNIFSVQDDKLTENITLGNINAYNKSTKINIFSSNQSLGNTVRVLEQIKKTFKNPQFVVLSFNNSLVSQLRLNDEKTNVSQKNKKTS